MSQLQLVGLFRSTQSQVSYERFKIENIAFCRFFKLQSSYAGLILADVISHGHFSNEVHVASLEI